MIKKYVAVLLLFTLIGVPVTADDRDRVEPEERPAVQPTQAEERVDERQDPRQRAERVAEIVRQQGQSIAEERIVETAREALNREGLSLEGVEQNEDRHTVFFRDEDNEQLRVTLDARTGELTRERGNENTTVFRGVDEETAQQLADLRAEVERLKEELREKTRELREARSLLEENNIEAESQGDVQVEVTNQPPEANSRAQNRESNETQRNNTPQGTPADQAQEAVNGTPGEENSQRPGFVSRMLQSMFG